MTDRFPLKEQYESSSQITRAAVSIPRNIIEGVAQHRETEVVQFLHIAKGLLSELNTQLELTKRFESVSKTEWVTLNERLERVDKIAVRDYPTASSQIMRSFPVSLPLTFHLSRFTTV